MSEFTSLPDNFDSVPRFFVSRYLDSPLIADSLQEECAEVNARKTLTKTTSHLLSLANHMSEVIWKKTFVSNVTINLVAGAPIDMINLAETVEDKLELPMQCEKITSEHATILNSILQQQGVDPKLSFSLTPASRIYGSRMMTLEAPQRKLVSLRARGSKAPVREKLKSSISSWCVMSDRYVLLGKKKDCSIKVFTYDMYLCALDISRVRFRACVAINQYSVSTGLENRMISQWEWQKKWVEIFGNEGFALAKQTEALAKAKLAQKRGSVFGEINPLIKMETKLREKVAKLAKETTAADSVFDASMKAYNDYTLAATDQELIELFGVQKATGHPFIYAERGGRSAAKEAMETQWVTHQTKRELRACFLSSLVAGYIAKERKWPKLMFSDVGTTTSIYRWYSASYLSVTEWDFDLSEWQYVIVGKNDDLDTFENYLDLIDDKAISFTRDEMEAYWDHSLQPTSSKRLLLEIMSREQFSFRAILELASEGKVPKTWKIVCLYPKEKELKPDPRMFSQMVTEIRSLFSGLEANIADKIFKYIPQQTMTKDKIQNQNLFYELTKPIDDQEFVSVFFECDLSRWNLHWRADTVDEIGSCLNHWFGVSRVFTFIHTFFESSVSVVRTPKLKPAGSESGDPWSGALVWYKHLAGNEGIGQKLWSLCTYAMVDRGMRKLPYSYILKGQGDNQIMSIRDPRAETVKNPAAYQALVKDVSEALEVCCSEVGQDLKPEECLEMVDLITYSKDIYLDGTQRFLQVKYASRIFARTNDQIPTLDAEISGIHAGCLAAAETSYQPLNASVLSAYYTSLELICRSSEAHPEWDKVSKSRKERLSKGKTADILKLLWLPPYLGGLSVSTYAEYIHRGTADPLAEQVGCLMRAASVSTMLSPLWKIVESDKYYEEEPKRVRLLQDPYCLPNKPGPTAEPVLNQMVAEYMKKAAKNKDISALVSPVTKKYADLMADALTTMDPFYPVLGREIIDNSAVGEALKIGKMFTNTQTLQRASRIAGWDGTSRIIDCSGLAIDHVLEKVFSLPSVSALRTTVRPTDQYLPSRLRDRWGTSDKRPYGVDAISPVFSNVTISDRPTNRSGIKLVGSWKGDVNTTRGDLKPYLGAATRLTVSSHGYKIVGTSKPAIALRKLQTVHSIPHVQQRMKDMISHLAHDRCTSVTDLDALGGHVLSSNMEHRFHGRESGRGSYTVGQGNLATHCFFVTDELAKVSGSIKDYPIMFQEWFTYALGILGADKELTSSPCEYVEVCLEPDTDQLQPLEMIACDISDPWTEHMPEELSRSRMVSDPNVWKLYHAGPQEIKNILSEIPFDYADSHDAVGSAILSLIVQSGYPLTATSAVLDGALGLRKPIEIDLAEVVRLTARYIVEMCSLHIAIEIGLRLISELQMPDSPGRYELYLHRMSTDFGEALAVTFSNPQLVCDEYIAKLGYHAKFKHDKSYPSAARMIYTDLKAWSRAYLFGSRGLPKRLYIFKSENTGRYSAMLGGLFGLMLMRALSGGWKWEQVVAVAKWTIVGDYLRSVHEHERSRILMRAVDQVLRRLHLPANALKLAKGISNATYIMLVNEDHRKVLRSIRMVNAPVAYDPTRLLRRLPPSSVGKPSSVCKCEYCTVWMMVSDQELKARVSRYYYPMVSSSTRYSLWLSLLSSVDANSMCLVGVGNGIAARVALDLGYKEVIGTDLLTAYDLQNLRLHRPPAAIAAHPLMLRFRWTDLTVSRESDILENRRLASLIERCKVDCLIIVDIHPGMLLDTFIDIISQGTKTHIICLRQQCAHSDYNDTINRLLSEKALQKVFYSIESSRVDILSVWKAGANSNGSSSSMSISNRRDKLTMMISLPSDAIAAVLFEDYRTTLKYQLTGEDNRTIGLRRSAERMRSVIGRVLYSSSYSTWTEELARLKCVEMLIEGSIIPQQVEELDNSDTTTISKNDGTTLTINISRRMRSLVQSTVVPYHWFFVRNMRLNTTI